MGFFKTIERQSEKAGLPQSRARRGLALYWIAICTGLLAAGAISQLAAQDPAPIQNQQLNQAPSPDATQATRVTIQGVVRNGATGDPLPRALVQLEGDADTGTLTDGEGRFELPRVPVGPQTLRIVKPGFRDRPYALEEGGLQAEGPAHSILVAAQMPELAFALSPNSAIHGRIELSTGDTADNIEVVLLKRIIHNGRGTWSQVAGTRTSGNGTYRFGGLPDGIYSVYTRPTLESEPAVSVVAPGSGASVIRNGYASVFYPDARDFAGAARIRLTAGSQAEANFSLALEPFYPVTAMAVAPGAGAGASIQPGNSAVVMDASGHSLAYLPQFDSTTHSLQVSLPDGSYSLLMRIPGGGEFLGKGIRRSSALAGAVQFTVADHAISGLRIPLAPPLVTVVQMRFIHTAEGRAPAPSSEGNRDLVNLSLDVADGIPQPGSENVWSMDEREDAIEFTAQPSSYWLSVALQRKGYCAGALSGGSVNLARDPLTISLSASQPPMDLDLHDDCGTLALTLPQALATFLPGEEPFYTVYVVPDFDTVQDIAPMTVHPSSGATLTLDGLTPGSYHVYTFNTPVHLEYRDPAVVAALSVPGQPVTLSAGATTNLALEVPDH